ncbi:BamA/TamA family outer membrane protein [Longibacter sp.]|uniref:BamA/TamA family outer membrane protein n=1 Tax=Longibacter sp. TaxID=2045415 RepID=UPI003EB7B848
MRSASQDHRLYSTRRAVLLFVLGLVLLLVSASRCDAQSEDPTASDTTSTWFIVVDGDTTMWADTISHAEPPNSPAGILSSVRTSGYYAARLDSVTQDTSASSQQRYAHIHRGPHVVLGPLQVDSPDSILAEETRTLLDLKQGEPLSALDLKTAIDDVLTAFEGEGYPLAEVRIDSVWLNETADPAEMGLGLQVRPGPRLWLKRVVLPPGTRTSPRFVARRGGLQLGEPLRNYDPGRLRTALQQTGLFDMVGPPELRVDADGGATLFIPIRDVSPGTFDVVIGYLPGTNGGQLVGNGRLALRNVLGGGRRLTLRLDRRPGQVSLLDVQAVDPYVAGRPIRTEVSFSGEQRDSTYGHRRYRLAVGVNPKPTWSVSVTGSREVVRPGQGGTAIVRNEQQIPRSSAYFYGVSATFERLDDPVNPRRGVEASARLEQGRKRRSLRRVVAGDTLTESETLRQERVTGSARLYLPTFNRQLIALGADAHLLRSDAYDESDLFRLGGAQTLRGYDEDRYAGRITLRGLVEYRVQLDPVSYAFAFADLGFVETPTTAEFAERRRVLPGYGIGLQFGTPLGVVLLSYALQPEESPARGRIHLGLSLGL